MTRALGTPQRGQTIPEVDRLAIGYSPYTRLDADPTDYDTLVGRSRLYELCNSLSLKAFQRTSAGNCRRTEELESMAPLFAIAIRGG